MKDFLRRILNIHTKEDFMVAKDKIQGVLVGLAIAGFIYILISKGINDIILLVALLVSLGFLILAWTVPKIMKFLGL
ncbi:MAG: hypothetical protein KAT49_05390 [Methanomicrobia archaeon]|nr:hypothetical protein [Methanomicrobia archaeon]